MNASSTIADLFTYDDWAMSKLFDIALALPDEQLDRPFEMGLGSLRATLIHIFGAKEIWLLRAQIGLDAKWTKIGDKFPISALRTRWNETSSKWLAQADADLERVVDYSDLQGKRHGSRLLDIMLHVVNHGTYHRAQASNMLRHVGATPPRIDYIFRKLEAPPKLSVDVVRYYFKCSDWMRDRVLDACENLSDAQLNRVFEMGLGTPRATLDHMAIAEEWWLASWRGKAIVGFPSPSGAASVADVRERFENVARARNEMLADPKGDLSRSVEGKPSAERTILFPIGVTMLQICLHGTHHRAQVVNMLKKMGHVPPRTDLILMTRKPV